MNYLDIVLTGYFNENNRQFLEKYFFREYRKAEKNQFIEDDEFFSGCLKVIKDWEKSFQNKVFERKRELYLMIDLAKKDTIENANRENVSNEKGNLDIIEHCEKDLKEVRPDGIGSVSFTLNLHSLTNGRIAHNLYYEELIQIKLSILRAFERAQNKTGSDKHPTTKEVVVKPITPDTNQSRVSEHLAAFLFFQIKVIADFEIDGKIYKDVEQRNNDSIITPENWRQHEETFFTQRMATYKDSYTLAEKLKLELSSLEKLPINKTDYQILKDRYKEYLVKKQALPPQPIDKEQNRTKQVIAETFENMDKKGWQYAFSTDQDYNLFTDLLTNFFEYKDYSIPETAIQLKRTCKTKVAKALGEIHAELGENPLNSDIEYFKIVKVLNHYREVSNVALVKAMQR